LRSSTDDSRRAAVGLITSGFPDAHARRRSCLVPPKTMGPLSTSRSPLPGRPGPAATGPSRPADFTHFEAFFPLRVRSRQPRANPDPTVDALLVLSSPSEIPCEPRSLEPAQFRGAGHAPSPGGSSARPRGQQPPAPGETSPTRQATPSKPLAATRSLPTGLHRLSAATPSPLTFELRRANPTSLWPSELPSIREVTPLRRATPASHGVLCLVGDLTTLEPQRSWLMDSPERRPLVTEHPHSPLDRSATPPGGL
jgi:hypothetical protein